MNKKDFELVSVVIPTYSRNNTLVRAITSVIEQTYKNIEIIVVDDNPEGSEWRKKTEVLMKRYESDGRICYLKNKKNLGGAGARNEGIKAAKGAFISFLDDDDEYLPTNIELKMQAFQNTNMENLALVYGHCEYVDQGRVVYENRKNFNGNCLFEAMRENCIAATSQWVVRKSALEKVGMFTIVPSKQDSQLLLKLLVAGYAIQCVPEILSRYYMDFGELSHISNNGRKPLDGELLYRTACRNQYYKLTAEQIIEVEYSFAVMLYEKYRLVNDLASAKNEKKRMYRLCPVKAHKYTIHQMLKNIKPEMCRRIGR